MRFRDIVAAVTLVGAAVSPVAASAAVATAPARAAAKVDHSNEAVGTGVIIAILAAAAIIAGIAIAAGSNNDSPTSA